MKLDSNKLSLNVKKTHYVIFKPGQKPVLPTEHLIINNKVIHHEETLPWCTVRFKTFKGTTYSGYQSSDGKAYWQEKLLTGQL